MSRQTYQQKERKLDFFISKKYNISRSLVQKYIKNKMVYCNGTVITNKNYQVKNEKITLRVRKPQIPILFENDNLIVVNKPKNLSVCRTFNTPKHEFVLNELIGKEKLCETPKKHEFGLINRLDKDASGIMILSKTQKFFEFISNHFQEMNVKKKYMAVTVNQPVCNENITQKNFHGFCCEHGYENFVLGEKKCMCEDVYNIMRTSYEESSEKILPSSEDNGDFMITGIREEKNHYLCYPITGKRHQIRFVLAENFGSIQGDVLYGRASKHNLRLFSIGFSFPKDDEIKVF